MKNKKLKYLILGIIIILGVIVIKNYPIKKTFPAPTKLNGTYQNVNDKFASLTFDEEQEVYYYYNTFEEGSSGTGLVAKGKFFKNKDGSYSIKQKNPIDEQTIICKKSEFTISIRGKKFVFEKIIHLPTIVLGDENI